MNTEFILGFNYVFTFMIKYISCWACSSQLHVLETGVSDVSMCTLVFISVYCSGGRGNLYTKTQTLTFYCNSLKSAMYSH